ncbi:MAG TPA: hypothetical protein VFG51_02745 [Candidatus Saccharimonadia bacterium]|nr:hypothetical protein [Candidatus Saccharimonadia bacterium]
MSDFHETSISLEQTEANCRWLRNAAIVAAALGLLAYATVLSDPGFVQAIESAMQNSGLGTEFTADQALGLFLLVDILFAILMQLGIEHFDKKAMVSAASEALRDGSLKKAH